MRNEDTIDIRATAFALLVSLGLHFLLFWLLPNTFKQTVVILHPVEVLTTPVKIDEARLPPKLRYAETNSAANQAVPKAADFVSSRNQTAAQPVPEKKPTRSTLPKSTGESKTVKVAQGKPRSIEVSEAAPTPEPAVAMAPKTAGSAPGAAAATQSKPAVEAAPKPVNPDRPRAMAAAGTTGLLLRNPVGVNRAGTVAISARFSNYGDYMQRMMEAIQSGWWDIIERSRFQSVSSGSVLIRFKLHRDGTVTDAQILNSDVQRIMALACKDAVMAPAPYDAWRTDMVALYGEDDIVTIHFIYR